MKSKVKTHKFRLGKFHIIILETFLYGLCDKPTKTYNHYILVPNNNDLHSLQTIVHEAMHAEGVPDRHLDGEYADAGKRIGKFLWRLGWRKTQ